MDMGGTSEGGGGGGMASGGGHSSSVSYTHMTFFWGRKSEILFQGWPGARGGMYAVALVVVFVLALLVEWLSHCRPRSMRTPAAAGLLRAAAHTVRVGLAYLLMLAVMSFNVGVLIVAIAGHAVGFLLFSGALSGKTAAAECEAQGGGGGGGLPPMKC